MTTATEPDISRLPKWAQEHIEKLNRQRTEEQQELRRLLDSSTPSKLYLNSRTMSLDDKVFIQDDSVNFILPNGEIEVYLEDNTLKLMARGPCTQIAVFPSVANVIRVGVVE